MRQIVGLIGTRGAGKDTAAAHLVANGWVRVAFADALYQEVARAFGVSVEFLNHRDTKERPLPQLALKHCPDPRFVAVALKATGICRAVRQAYGQPRKAMPAGVFRRLKKVLTQPRSPRWILQLWGTEYRRRLDGDDYWRQRVAALITAAPNHNFVVTDVRFINEAMLLKQYGATLARVIRPSLAGGADPALLHVSEREMLSYPTDYEVVNEEGEVGIANLHSELSRLFIPQALAA